MTENQNISYCFISEEEYYNALKNGSFHSLVRMKVFNKIQHEDQDRTVYLSIESTNQILVIQRIEEIRKFEFNWAKSFSEEVNINEKQ
jgi:hypothetical protein